MALFNALLSPSPLLDQVPLQRALTRKKKISLLRETSLFLIKGRRSIQQVVLFSTNVLVVYFIRIHPFLRIRLLPFSPFSFTCIYSCFEIESYVCELKYCTYLYIYIPVSTILRESSCDIVEQVNEVEWKFPSNHEWYPINRIEDRLDPINRSKKRVRVLPRILPTRRTSNQVCNSETVAALRAEGGETEWESQRWQEMPTYGNVLASPPRNKETKREEA